MEFPFDPLSVGDCLRVDERGGDKTVLEDGENERGRKERKKKKVMLMTLEEKVKRKMLLLLIAGRKKRKKDAEPMPSADLRHLSA